MISTSSARRTSRCPTSKTAVPQAPASFFLPSLQCPRRKGGDKARVAPHLPLSPFVCLGISQQRHNRGRQRGPLTELSLEAFARPADGGVTGFEDCRGATHRAIDGVNVLSTCFCLADTRLSKDTAQCLDRRRGRDRRLPGWERWHGDGRNRVAHHASHVPALPAQACGSKTSIWAKVQAYWRAALLNKSRAVACHLVANPRRPQFCDKRLGCQGFVARRCRRGRRARRVLARAGAPRWATSPVVLVPHGVRGLTMGCRG